jgi:hypothetical protein
VLRLEPLWCVLLETGEQPIHEAFYSFKQIDRDCFCIAVLAKGELLPRPHFAPWPIRKQEPNPPIRPAVQTRRATVQPPNVQYVTGEVALGLNPPSQLVVEPLHSILEVAVSECW